MAALTEAARDGAPWRDLATLAGITPTTLTRLAKWAQAEDPTGPSDPLEGLIGDGFRQLGEAEDADAVRKLIGAIREGRRAGREALKLTRRKLIEGDPKPGDVARLQAVQRALARADPRPRARVRLPAVSHIGGGRRAVAIP